MATSTWENIDDLKWLIEQYFAKGGKVKTRWVKTGRETSTEVEYRVFTYSWLSRALWYFSKNALEKAIRDCEDGSEIQIALMNAMSQIDEDYEGNLPWANSQWSIFALKNRGWDDKHQVDVGDFDKILEDIIK